jgi:hypothetical protein
LERFRSASWSKHKPQSADREHHQGEFWCRQNLLMITLLSRLLVNKREAGFKFALSITGTWASDAIPQQSDTHAQRRPGSSV